MRSILHTRAHHTPVQSKQLGRREKTTKAPQHPQPLRSLFRQRYNVILKRKITRKRYAQNIKKRRWFELRVFKEDIISGWKIFTSGQMEELSFGGIENHKILFTPITQLEMRARSEVS